MQTSVFVGTIWQDLAYSLRAMRKNAGFTITAVLTLALGIGGNTAIFTVIRAVLLKPLSYGAPDRLVYFSVTNPKKNVPDGGFGRGWFEEMQAASRSFTAIGAFLKTTDNVIASGQGDPEVLLAARVSANYLEILGVSPLLGRSFSANEDSPGGPLVAMISERLWKRRFGSDPHAVGKTAILDSKPYTIVGVLPPGFEFPYAATDVWLTRPSEWSRFAPRYWSILPVLCGFGRLKANVSVDQAIAEMEVINQQYNRAHPSNLTDGQRMHVVLLKDRLVANIRMLLWMLFGAVAFVLLIACANVASLLLARATSRSREFALRAALGANRSRLVRQLLAESLLLALAGGCLGVLLAKSTLLALQRFDGLSFTSGPSPLYLPGATQLHLDGQVLLFTILLSLATGIVFGLFPSLQVSRPNLIETLREMGAGAGRGVAGRKRTFGVSTRGLMVIGQIALSMVLLIGATLLLRSFARLHGVDPGFPAANLLTMKIALPPARYDTDRKRDAFFEELTRRLETLPGVKSATMALTLPTTTWVRTNIATGESQPSRDPNESFGVYQTVTPGYFQTLGIQIRRGRGFSARDNSGGAPPAMIINEAMARELWKDYPRGPDPIGKHITEGYDRLPSAFEVIGVAADIHEGGLATEAPAEMYVPCALHPPQTAYMALRTSGDPLRLASAARNVVLAIDSDQAISDVKTMEDVFEATMGQRRMTMLLIGSFAGIALVLAIIGIYGAIAYSVAQRTQEVGIRRALGAQQSDILRLILGQGLALALAGAVIGILCALALTRLLSSLLFQVSATDPATFAGIALIFVAVALAATYVPARRAARIDPRAAIS